MITLLVFLTILLCPVPATAAGPAAGFAADAAASTTAPRELRDLYFGEALFEAFQGQWFDAIARLDTELQQHRGLDQPRLDTLSYHIGQARFGVGDFELAYRMHQRAGRAVSAVIEGNVAPAVRNEALFRLARIYFRKDQPRHALQAVERIDGEVPEKIRDDLAYLRAEIFLATGRLEEAAQAFEGLQGIEGLEGFATYNLGIARLREGKDSESRRWLDRTGLLAGDSTATLAIRDKANLVLGSMLLEKDEAASAKEVLDRVRLEGPFSNKALLGSGWADASRGRYQQALVPWSLLAEREVTDPSVQEVLLALPYAYGKLGVYGRAALLYGRALEVFGSEIDKLGASIKSIREGNFLRALVREELQHDADWMVRLRRLPGAPETYYLLDLLASHDFRESLKNYLDLEQLRRKLAAWDGDLDAWEELIARRRAYYEPLLPGLDRAFRRIDSRMRLRLEQRDHLERRLQAMLTAPRPEYLATARERLFRERLARLEEEVAAAGTDVPDAMRARIRRLRGVLTWNIRTDYDRRLTQTFRDLEELNQVLDRLQHSYTAFVRRRQAVTQSYRGYEETIRRQRLGVRASRDKVAELMARQGHMLEVMAVNELTRRRQRLEEFQVRARFALADSYDRAARAQSRKQVEP